MIIDDLSADSRRGERVAVYRVQRLEMRGLELARGYATRQHSSESGNAGSKLSRSLNHILIFICLYIYISVYTHTYIYTYIHINESVYSYQNLHLHKSLHDLTSSCSHILPQSLIQTRFSPSFQIELRWRHGRRGDAWTHHLPGDLFPDGEAGEIGE